MIDIVGVRNAVTLSKSLLASGITGAANFAVFIEMQKKSESLVFAKTKILPLLE